MVSEELRDWIVDNFDWTTKHRPNWHDTAQLVIPTSAFFDAPAGDIHTTALHIMYTLKDLLTLEGKIELEPLKVLPDELRHTYGQMSQVAGQYMQEGAERLIPYDPTLLRTPLQFIDTMTHELMHARLAGVINDLPGGETMHELATDLHCIIAGFGLFQLEGHEQSGWSGYMPQPARATALAMFLKFHDLELERALPYLTRRPARWLRNAWEHEATSVR